MTTDRNIRYYLDYLQIINEQENLYEQFDFGKYMDSKVIGFETRKYPGVVTQQIKQVVDKLRAATEKLSSPESKEKPFKFKDEPAGFSIAMHPIAALEWWWDHHFLAFKYTTTGRLIVGASAIVAVAMLAVMAYHIYNVFFEKGMQECKKFKYGERERCIKEQKKNAMMLRIKSLEKLTDDCKKSKEPLKCKALMAKRIVMVKRELARVK